jgi:hypothetical protein
MLDRFLRHFQSTRGKNIIYVKSGQRLNFLQEFQHREDFDVFTKNHPHYVRILLITTQDVVIISGIETNEKNHKDHYFLLTFLEGVTTVLNFDVPTDLPTYKWKITRGRDLPYVKKDVLSSFIDFSNHDLCFGLHKSTSIRTQYSIQIHT